MQIKFLNSNLFLTALLIIFTNNFANAQIVENIYQTAILVPDSNEQTRMEAASKSLKQILVRSSGKMNILLEDGLDTYLDNALTYVEQYRYEHTRDRIRLENNREVWAQKLYLTFNENGIKNILNDFGYALWNKDRPRVIPWIIVKDGANTYTLSENLNDLAKSLKYILWSRAVPNYFPKFNSTDAKYITASEIWQLNIKSAKKASETYNAKASVVGRMYKYGDTWVSDWIIGDDFKNTKFSLKNKDANTLIRLAGNNIVEILAEHYADEKSSFFEQTNVNIGGITSLEQYSALLDFFKKDKNINDIQLLNVSQNRLKFSIKLTTTENKFFYYLKNDPKFNYNGANNFTWR